MGRGQGINSPDGGIGWGNIGWAGGGGCSKWKAGGVGEWIGEGEVKEI